MARVDVLLFDLDGTLVDSRADIAAAANYMRRSYKRDPLPVRDVARMIGDGLKVLVDRCLADARDVDRDEAIDIYRTYYREHCVDATHCYDGIEEALAALAALPKVVVTNKPETFSRTILQRLGLAPHFTGLVGGDTCRTKKPDPAMVRYGIELAGAGPDATAAIIGDGHTDIAAGNAAGIVTCAVGWGIGDRGRLYEQSPQLVAETPADLLRLFGG